MECPLPSDLETGTGSQVPDRKGQTVRLRLRDLHRGGLTANQMTTSGHDRKWTPPTETATIPPLTWLGCTVLTRTASLCGRSTGNGMPTSVWPGDRHRKSSAGPQRPNRETSAAEISIEVAWPLIRWPLPIMTGSGLPQRKRPLFRLLHDWGAQFWPGRPPCAEGRPEMECPLPSDLETGTGSQVPDRKGQTVRLRLRDLHRGGLTANQMTTSGHDRKWTPPTETATIPPLTWLGCTVLTRTASLCGRSTGNGMPTSVWPGDRHRKSSAGPQRPNRETSAAEISIEVAWPLIRWPLPIMTGSGLPQRKRPLFRLLHDWGAQFWPGRPPCAEGRPEMECPLPSDLETGTGSQVPDRKGQTVRLRLRDLHRGGLTANQMTTSGHDRKWTPPTETATIPPLTWLGCTVLTRTASLCGRSTGNGMPTSVWPGDRHRKSSAGPQRPNRETSAAEISIEVAWPLIRWPLPIMTGSGLPQRKRPLFRLLHDWGAQFWPGRPPCAEGRPEMECPLPSDLETGTGSQVPDRKGQTVRLRLRDLHRGGLTANQMTTSGHDRKWTPPTETATIPPLTWLGCTVLTRTASLCGRSTGNGMPTSVWPGDRHRKSSAGPQRPNRETSAAEISIEVAWPLIRWPLPIMTGSGLPQRKRPLFRLLHDWGAQFWPGRPPCAEGRPEMECPLPSDLETGTGSQVPDRKGQTVRLRLRDLHRGGLTANQMTTSGHDRKWTPPTETATIPPLTWLGCTVLTRTASLCGRSTGNGMPTSVWPGDRHRKSSAGPQRPNRETSAAEISIEVAWPLIRWPLPIMTGSGLPQRKRPLFRLLHDWGAQFWPGRPPCAEGRPEMECPLPSDLETGTGSQVPDRKGQTVRLRLRDLHRGGLTANQMTTSGHDRKWTPPTETATIPPLTWLGCTVLTRTASLCGRSTGNGMPTSVWPGDRHRKSSAGPQRPNRETSAAEISIEVAWPLIRWPLPIMTGSGLPQRKRPLFRLLHDWGAQFWPGRPPCAEGRPEMECPLPSDLETGTGSQVPDRKGQTVRLRLRDLHRGGLTANQMTTSGHDRKWTPPTETATIPPLTWLGCTVLTRTASLCGRSTGNGMPTSVWPGDRHRKSSAGPQRPNRETSAAEISIEVAWPLIRWPLPIMTGSGLPQRKRPLFRLLHDWGAQFWPGRPPCAEGRPEMECPLPSDLETGTGSQVPDRKGQTVRLRLRDLHRGGLTANQMTTSGHDRKWTPPTETATIPPLTWLGCTVLTRTASLCGRSTGNGMPTSVWPGDRHRKSSAGPQRPNRETSAAEISIEVAWPLIRWPLPIMTGSGLPQRKRPLFRLLHDWGAQFWPGRPPCAEGRPEMECPLPSDLETGTGSQVPDRKGQTVRLRLRDLHRGGLTANQMTTSGHDRKWTPPTETATIPPLTWLGCTVLTRTASLCGRSTGNGMPTSVWPGDRHRKSSAGPQRPNRETSAAEISIEVAWPLIRWPLPIMTGSGLPQRKRPLFRLLHDWGAQFWPGRPPCAEGRPEMECPLPSDLETGTGSQVPDRKGQTVRLRLRDLHRGGLTANQMTTSGHDRKWTPPTETATIPPLTWLGCTVLTRTASLCGRSTGNGMPTSVWPGDRHRKSSAGPQRPNRETSAAEISIEVAWPLIRWPLPIMTGSGLPQRKRPLFRLLHDWGAQFWPGRPPCAEGRPEMECPLPSDLETGTGSQVPDRKGQTVRLRLRDLHRGGLTANQMTTSGHDRKWTPPTETATIPPLTWLGCTVLTRTASLCGRSTGNGMPTSVWPGDRHRKSSAGPQRPNRETSAAEISIEVAWPLIRWPLPIMTGSGLPQRKRPLFRLLHDWGAQFWPGRPPCAEGRPEMECPLPSDLETGTGSQVPDRKGQTVRLRLRDLHRGGLTANQMTTSGHDRKWTPPTETATIPPLTWLGCTVLTRTASLCGRSTGNGMPTSVWPGDRHRKSSAGPQRPNRETSAAEISIEVAWPLIRWPLPIMTGSGLPQRKRPLFRLLHDWGAQFWPGRPPCAEGRPEMECPLPSDLETGTGSQVPDRKGQTVRLRLRDLHRGGLTANQMTTSGHDRKWTPPTETATIPPLTWLGCTVLTRTASLCGRSTGNGMPTSVWPGDRHRKSSAGPQRPNRETSAAEISIEVAWPLIRWPLPIMTGSGLPQRKRPLFRLLHDWGAQFWPGRPPCAEGRPEMECPLPSDLETGTGSQVPDRKGQTVRLRLRDLHRGGLTANQMTTSGHDRKWTPPTETATIPPLTWLGCTVLTRTASLCGRSTGNGMPTSVWPGDRHRKSSAGPQRPNRETSAAEISIEVAWPLIRWPLPIMTGSGLPQRKRPLFRLLHDWGAQFWPGRPPCAEGRPEMECPLPSDLETGTGSQVPDRKGQTVRLRLRDLHRGGLTANQMTTSGHDRKWTPPTETATIPPLTWLGCTVLTRTASLCGRSTGNGMPTSVWPGDRHRKSSAGPQRPNRETSAAEISIEVAWPLIRWPLPIMTGSGLPQRKRPLFRLLHDWGAQFWPGRPPCAEGRPEMECPLPSDLETGTGSQVPDRKGQTVRLRLRDLHRGGLTANQMTTSGHDRKWTPPTETATIPPLTWLGCTVLTRTASLCGRSTGNGMPTSVWPGDRHRKSSAGPQRPNRETSAAEISIEVAWPLIRWPLPIMTGSGLPQRKRPLFRLLHDWGAQFWPGRPPCAEGRPEMECPLPSDLETGTGSQVPDRKGQTVRLRLRDLHRGGLTANQMTTSGHDRKWTPPTETATIPPLTWLGCTVLTRTASLCGRSTGNGMPTSVWPGDRHRKSSAGPQRPNRETSAAEISIEVAWPLIRWPLPIMTGSGLPQRKRPLFRLLHDWGAQFWPGRPPCAEGRPEMECPLPSDLETGTGSQVPDRKGQTVRLRLRDLHRGGLTANQMTTSGHDRKWTPPTETATIPPLTWLGCTVLTRTASLCGRSTGNGMPTSVWPGDRHRKSSAGPQRPNRETSAAEISIEVAWPLIRWPLPIMTGSGLPQRKRPLFRLLHDWGAQFWPGRPPCAEGRPEMECPLPSDLETGTGSQVPDRKGQTVRLRLRDLHRGGLTGSGLPQRKRPLFLLIRVECPLDRKWTPPTETAETPSRWPDR